MKILFWPRPFSLGIFLIATINGLMNLLILIGSSHCLKADLVPVVNSGFEDTDGQTVFNEFTFGIPVGWERHDPNNIQGGGVFWGTLMPNGTDFFNTTAPEGD